MTAFFNLHTHCPRQEAGTEEIVNWIIGRDKQPFSCPMMSAGIHPWYIYNVEEQMHELEMWLSQREEAVAIGEAGLDKRAEAPMETQTDVFLRQAVLAEKVRKPLIVHCVKAWDELLMLRRQLRPAMPWVVHGFRGKGEQARQLLRQGLLLSFGWHFQADALQAARQEGFFLETDEADVSIRDVYRKAAETLQVPEKELVRAVGKWKINRIFARTKTIYNE